MFVVLNDCPRFEFPPKHTPITGLHTGGGDATIKLRSRINIVVDPTELPLRKMGKFKFFWPLRAYSTTDK